MRKGSFNRDPVQHFRARELRSEMSESERRLWTYLRRDRLGFRFRRQVRVDCYILDFYCAKAKLCVEVDGEQHSRTVAYDRRRDEVLRKLGIETIRIPSLDLFTDAARVNAWLAKLEMRCLERVSISTPQPPSSLTNQSEEGGSERSGQ